MSRPLRSSAMLRRTELDPMSTAARTGILVRQAGRRTPPGVPSLAAYAPDYGNQAGWSTPGLQPNILTSEEHGLPPEGDNSHDCERTFQPLRKVPPSHAIPLEHPALTSSPPETASVHPIRPQAPPDIESISSGYAEHAIGAASSWRGIHTRRPVRSIVFPLDEEESSHRQRSPVAPWPAPQSSEDG